MHEQMIHFVWKTWSTLKIITHQSYRPLFSWTNALTLIILKNVSVTEKVSWCRHSKFSQKPYGLQVTSQSHEPMTLPIGV